MAAFPQSRSAGTLSIRPATAEDLPAVSALLGRTWHATYDGIYGAERVTDITGRWHAVATLAKGLGDPSRCFLVAEVNGRIAGTASVSRCCGGTVKLDRLYVDPDLQGRGIGSRLLDASLCAFSDASRMTIEVEPANHRAIAFYERYTFRTVGSGTDCCSAGDGIAHLVMARRLGPTPAAEARAQTEGSAS